jgi:hypothetical protein
VGGDVEEVEEVEGQVEVKVGRVVRMVMRRDLPAVGNVRQPVELQEPGEEVVEVEEEEVEEEEEVVVEVLQEQVELEGLVKRVMRRYPPAVGNVRQPVEVAEEVEVLQEQTVVV